MNSALDVLDELESTSGRLAKEKILLREKGNDVLRSIFSVANNPYLVFYVNKFARQRPQPSLRGPENVDSDMVGFVQFLFSLSRREIVGNAAKSAVEAFLGRSTPQEQKWMERILLKNLRVGVQSSTISKVWPNLIPGFAVQLANTLDVQMNEEQTRIEKILSKIDYPVWVDAKLDGFRLIAIKEKGKVSLWTRNGNELDNLPELKKVLEKADYDDFVLDGEIFGTDWSVSASVVLSEVNTKDETLLNYNVFDCVPVSDWKNLECSLTHRERFKKLVDLTDKITSGRVQLVLGCYVGSDAELIEQYDEHISSGWEGAMIKAADGTYDFTRSSSVLKMKPKTTHEGVVVGWYEGKPNTKWEGLFGGFEVMLTNGVTTRVGTGFKDPMRASIYDDGPTSYKGKIVELEGQLLTDDGKIRFPRFKRFRDARDVDPSVVALAQSYK